MTADDIATQQLSQQLADAGLRIDRELHRTKMRFSDEAGVALVDAHASFLGDLGVEAVRLTRKDRLTTVDRVHVEKAADRLGPATGPSGVASACNTVGGLVVGAGIAGTYRLAFDSGTHSTTQMMVTIALCVVGCILLAVGLTLTLTKRH
ncbi:hypothetical protein ACTXG5_08290 [Mycobacterium sp. Dal123C01]|uniref:hypothetical protein n=1 Tax=Mycobacterium sp. Dal123C01 TaxID=3457577 RepID=UPI00403ED50F